MEGGGRKEGRKDCNETAVALEGGGRTVTKLREKEKKKGMKDQKRRTKGKHTEGRKKGRKDIEERKEGRKEIEERKEGR